MIVNTVPEWIHASDVWVAMYSDTDLRGGRLEGVAALSLPQCELDCGDALRLYRVMGAWCFSWDNVPKAVFVPLWWALTPQERCSALLQYGYFREELGQAHWTFYMIDHDDGTMYNTYCPDHLVYNFIVTGAVQCLEAFIQLNGIDAVSNKLCRSYYELVPKTPYHKQQRPLLQVLQLLERYNHPFDYMICSTLSNLCARYGFIDCVMFLCENGYMDTTRDGYLGYNACRVATEYGHLNCIKYLCDRRSPNRPYELSYVAAYFGHLNCLQYFCENGHIVGSSALVWAAASGHNHCIAYMLCQGYEMTARTITVAAQQGRLECVRYLHEHGCPWDREPCNAAAAQGQLECLRYLHNNGCPWDEFTLINAATYGHLDCLQYAHEHGCPRSKIISIITASPKNIDCIIFIRERICILNDSMYLSLVSNGWCLPTYLFRRVRSGQVVSVLGELVWVAWLCMRVLVRDILVTLWRFVTGSFRGGVPRYMPYI